MCLPLVLMRPRHNTGNVMYMVVHYTSGLTQVLRLPATHLRMLRDQCALAEQQPGEAPARDSVMESTWRAGTARAGACTRPLFSSTQGVSNTK